MPSFTREQQLWFMAIIEGMVSNPKAANIGRARGTFDIAVVIMVAPEDEGTFTAEVCVALAELLKAVTGAAAPVVYLLNKPHPAVQEAILAVESYGY